jgi:predicted SAM-dependent methyltransferase
MILAKKKTFKQKLGSLIIPRLPVTRENFDRVRFEINAAIVNFNNTFNPVSRYKIFKLRKEKNLSVNIGAGPFGKPGWINIDLFRHKNISLRYDCRSRLPFSDSSIDRLKCEHLLEHLDIRDEVPHFLNECLRCLKPNSIFRIVVPDVELFIMAYCSGKKEEWAKIGFTEIESQWGSGMYILNHVFRQNGEHKFGYDFKTLKGILEKAGFESIKKTSFGNSEDLHLRDDLENHRPYSLYVDCKKPINTIVSRNNAEGWGR